MDEKGRKARDLRSASTKTQGTLGTSFPSRQDGCDCCQDREADRQAWLGLGKTESRGAQEGADNGDGFPSAIGEGGEAEFSYDVE